MNSMTKIFFALFTFLSIGLSAQVTIMTQNFENGGSIPSGWTQEFVSSNVNWTFATGGSSSNPAAAHGGTYNARFYSGNYNVDKTKLVTPVINLNGYTNCQLNFWHAQVNWVGDQDTLKVYYKTTLGGAWTLLAAYGAEAATWTLRTINLPNPTSTYYIAFEGISGYGYGVCVDDVSVTGTIPIVTTDTILVNSANNNLQFNTCNAVVYDNGGPSGNYTNNNNFTITIKSNSGGCVRAILDFYNIENNYDYLYFYDGPNTSSPQIGQRVTAYAGFPVSTVNRTGNAYIALSGYLTIKFTSDGATVAQGFKIKIDCPANCVAPSCSGTSPAGSFCSSPTPICNLNGYCGNTSSSYPTDHEEIDAYNLGIFCGGINNNSWLSFVPESTTAVLDVWVKNCTGQTIHNDGIKRGIQLQVFSTNCAYGNFTPKSNCWSPGEEMNGQITATGLTPGSTYLIMIDGYAQDNCEYVFAASSGIIVANAGSDKTICEGEYVNLTASGGTNVLWSASPTDPSLNGQTSNMSITVSPGQTTTYTAQVWGSNPLCTTPADVVVFVNSASASFTGLDDKYCNNSSSVSLTGNFPTGVFSGNGLTGSTFNPNGLPQGNTNVSYTYNYSVVTAFTDNFDPTPKAGWTTGWSSLGSTGTQGNSWTHGKPKGGKGSSTSTNADPLIDHSPNIENYVYGQGLGSGTGDGVGGNYDNSLEWLRSPAINCTGLRNTVLSFWRYCNLETNYDEGYVKISNNGTTWYDLGEPLYPTDNGWTQRIINISQYADNKATVYIRWESQSDGATTYSGWNIDDITVTGVQSGGSCVSTDIQSTYINSVITATISGVNPTCNGSTNGSATVTPTGGTAPYTYVWSNGQTTQTASNLAAGTHYVTINDQLGVCAGVVKSITISQPSAISLTTSSTSSTCGQSNGSASVVASGGAGGYSYLWTGGATTASITNKPAGSYSVTVADATGCTKTSTVNITDAGAPSASINSYSNINCYGGNNGSALVTATGGGGGYTYLWSNSQTTASVSNLSAGVYSVTVKDVNNCNATASVTITQPTDLIVTSSQINVKCNGANTGSVNLTVSGGTPIYTYTWSSGQSTQNISSLVAGTYIVTVKDANNCSKTNTVTITQPAALSANITSTPILCNGNTSSATVNVTGGTPSYTYLWSNFQMTQSINNIAAGTYTVSIQDANSCTATSSVTISQPSAINITNTVSNVVCFGQANGSINISVTGGTPNYSFSWSNGQTSEDISSLAAGNYNLTLTDANNCKAYAGINVNQPDQLIATPNANNLLCYNVNNGSVSLNVSGGTPIYTYYWSNNQTTQSISSLSAGNYAVTVTDNKLCTTTASVTLTQPSEIILTTSSTASSCGNPDGTATVNASGGTAPYTYLWSNGNTNSSISNIVSGAYNVTVTDNNSCTKTSSVNVNDAGAATISLNSSTNVTCYGSSNGTASINVSGGTPPFNYIWTSGSTNANATGLSGGINSVTVTDANTCISTFSVSISEPSVITINPNVVNISCYGSDNGRIDIVVTGGTPSYSYLWSNGASSQNITNLAQGTYTVTITDANGCTKTSTSSITQPSGITNSNITQNVSCNGKSDASIDLSVNGGVSPYNYLWSNGQISQDITGLGAGTYSVTITDANSCTSNATVTVTQPTLISYTVSKTNIMCFGGANGAIDITITGGTAPYIYQWSNGFNTQDIDNLNSGNYTVTVSDNNQCDATFSVSISEPAQLVTSITGTNVTCNGLSNGNINLTVSGGVLPYTYSWNHGQTSQDLYSISGGTYEVTITDNNGCSAFESYTITEPNIITINSQVTNVSCYQVTNGSITLTVQGGNPDYTYAWTGGASTQNLTNIQSGTYTVTVTDVNNCYQIHSATVSQPTILAAVIISNNVSCYGFNDGTADLTIVGGTSPYNFTWSNGSWNEDQTSLSPGTYNVTVADIKGCTKTDSVVISQPLAPLSASITNFTNIVCYKANNGTAEVDINGGTQPYTVNWSNNQNDTLAEKLTAGVYYLTVTDNNGCIVKDTVTILESSEINYSYVANRTSCKGSADGRIEVSVTGNDKPYTFTWSNNLILKDSINSNLTYGTYQVTIIDKNNCTVNDTIYVLSGDNVCIEIPTCFTPNGDGVNDNFEIKYWYLYPNIKVEIYNRWGIMLFKSDGYNEPWDGTYNGKELPIGSFVYIIDLGDGSEILTGTVSIVK